MQSPRAIKTPLKTLRLPTSRAADDTSHAMQQIGTTLETQAQHLKQRFFLALASRMITPLITEQHTPDR
jgi:hypothetical protein